MLVFRGVNWTEIKNFFSMRVSETLIGQRQSTESDQENSSPTDWLHLNCDGD